MSFQNIATLQMIQNIIDGTTPPTQAINADNATKATQDGNGNVITTTYATQTALSSEISARQSADSWLQSAVNAKYTKPSTGIPESDLSESVQASLAKADSAFQVPNNMVIGKTVSNPNGGVTYINCTLSGSFSLSGNYYFINCSGTITVDGTWPKVYITNSPNLTVNGITSSNWRNIYIDGEASYIARNSNITINLNSTVTIGTGIQDNREDKYEVLMSIPDNGSHYITGRGGTTYICPNYDKTKTEFIQFTIDSSYNLKCNPQFGESYFIVTWVRFSRKLEA